MSIKSNANTPQGDLVTLNNHLIHLAKKTAKVPRVRDPRIVSDPLIMFLFDWVYNVLAALGE